MKQIIGLTGGTGSGKSKISQYFKELGATVIDADKISREVCEKGTPAVLEIEKEFPETVTDGVLDRRALGRIVFGDKKALECLNKITHKYIIERTSQIIKESEGLIVLDSPLLYEAGQNSLCDKVIFVDANEDIRLERIMCRDSLSKEDAVLRINARDLEKIKHRADYIVENNGTEEELKVKFNCMVERLRSETTF